MATPKRQRLDKAIALLQGRYGAHIVQPASRLSAGPPPHIATGFTRLDALTGCGGIPLGAITLLTGRTTSGKLTLAYKALAYAQQREGGPGARPIHRTPHPLRDPLRDPRRDPLRDPLRDVAILDLTLTANPDYLARCGIDLAHILFVRVPAGQCAVDVVFELARDRSLRAVVVDGIADLLHDRRAAGYFDAALPQLSTMLKALPCAVIFLDEPQPPWLRWLRLGSGAIAHYAALHIDLKRERWLERNGVLVGYESQAQVVRSRWARGGQTAPVAVEFNGTIKARETW